MGFRHPVMPPCPSLKAVRSKRLAEFDIVGFALAETSGHQVKECVVTCLPQPIFIEAFPELVKTVHGFDPVGQPA